MLLKFDLKFTPTDTNASGTRSRTRLERFSNASGARSRTRPECVLERVQNAFFITLLLSSTVKTQSG